MGTAYADDMANVGNLFPALLIVLFLGAVVGGTVVAFLVASWRRKQMLAEDAFTHSFSDLAISLKPLPLQRPTTWLAVRSRNVHAVQVALGLHNVQPCTWIEGLSGEEKLFIAPPVKGWVLIIGSGLPDPADDVDVCFRFLTSLSQKLGHVQFFKANRVLGHHAWVRVDNGEVMRGYAWAGKTLWNQGVPTRAESEFGLKCFQYFESPDQTFEESEIAAANVEKVSSLASRWSLDPASVDENLFEHAYGIAGEPPRLF
jgi:hypothetical protein